MRGLDSDELLALKLTSLGEPFCPTALKPAVDRLVARGLLSRAPCEYQGQPYHMHTLTSVGSMMLRVYEVQR